jgi:hypothetical protein
MTLVRLDNGQTILIDVNIRGAADDEDDDTPNVAQDLRGRLDRDESGRLYVDAFSVSHPHSDHTTGLRNHFHLGPPDEWNEDDDKILIREVVAGGFPARECERRKPLRRCKGLGGGSATAGEALP